jgi:hypothetical protein
MLVVAPPVFLLIRIIYELFSISGMPFGQLPICPLFPGVFEGAQ